jgi:hypothetical protein
VRQIKPRQPVVENPVELRKRVENLLERIRDVSIRSDPSKQAEAKAILTSLPSVLKSPDQFVAETFTSCYPAWEALLKGSKRKLAKTVLGWLKNGVKPQFVGTSEAKQSKRKLVVGMLKRQVPASEIPNMLTGHRPHPISFPNHKSFYDNLEFTFEEASELVLWSAATIWREGMEKPLVIHPLGVAFTGGKGRLIVNARYANMFMRLLAFRYERLRDILAFTNEGYFMFNWDLKSGYYHVLLHSDYRKYFGIQIENIILQLNVVFFGYAQACYAFKKIMQKPCFELRAASIPIFNYVDDGFTAAATKLACLWQAIFAVLLQAVLGAYHGLAKCQIEPVLVIKWLGFLVDSEGQQFEVAASKIEKLKEFLQLTLSKESVSPRDLAQVAGKIISLSPAVAPAALYSRAFFQAIKGRISWDTLSPNPAEVRHTLQFWLDKINGFNGRPWWPKPVALQAVVDASRVGFGGVLAFPRFAPVRFQGTFSEFNGSGRFQHPTGGSGLRRSGAAGGSVGT